MIIPDLNLLIYAYDMRSSFHETSRRWWEAAISGSEIVGMPEVVLFGFIRICTRKSIYTDPISLAEATGIVDRWLESPFIYVLHGSDQHLRMTMQLLAHHGAGGNLTTDAQIAAHALMNDATIYTNDTDFSKFPDITHHNPLT